MPVKRYKKDVFVDAIQFEGIIQEHFKEIAAFTGYPISFDLKEEDKVKLRIERGKLDVLEAGIGDYVLKDEANKLRAMKKADFETEYPYLVD